MGNAVKGKERLLYIDNGSGTLVEVPFQGDGTYNPGKTAGTSRTKNGSHPYATDAGATFTTNIEFERPMLAVHTRLQELSASGEIIAVEVRDKNIGGQKYSGTAQIVLGEEQSGVDGVLSQALSVNFADDPVTGTVTA
ncbi:hypothetical protein [Mangrovicoccus sp. HB161399]|uniref:hypothetical protein n=1 Tax=Mangrovicoccus sp. HB161399 TaxID=2720392 RepID=UPI0015539B6E|nr:hypothetical protein [Mangrovicoccus sp. HB161399]